MSALVRWERTGRVKQVDLHWAEAQTVHARRVEGADRIIALQLPVAHGLLTRGLLLRRNGRRQQRRQRNYYPQQPIN